jgi:hypothetical protein
MRRYIAIAFVERCWPLAERYVAQVARPEPMRVTVHCEVPAISALPLPTMDTVAPSIAVSCASPEPATDTVPQCAATPRARTLPDPAT